MKPRIYSAHQRRPRNLRSALETIKTQRNYIAAWLLGLRRSPTCNTFRSEGRWNQQNSISSNLPGELCRPEVLELKGVRSTFVNIHRKWNSSREVLKPEADTSCHYSKEKRKQKNWIESQETNATKTLWRGPRVERMEEIFKSSTLRLSRLEPVILHNFLLFINDFWFSSFRLRRLVRLIESHPGECLIKCPIK